MASSYCPKYKRFLIKCLPFLFKKYPQKNYHFILDKLCYCGKHEHYGVCKEFPMGWSGGIYDFKLKKEIF